MYSAESLGKLVLIELDKQRLPLFPEDSWFPTKVEVKSPEGAVYHFPIYRWIDDSKVHRFREGTGLGAFFFFFFPQGEGGVGGVICANVDAFPPQLIFGGFFTQALRAFEDTHLLGRHSREQELKEREEEYR